MMAKSERTFANGTRFIAFGLTWFEYGFSTNGLGFYKWYGLILGQLRETVRSQRKDKHKCENKRLLY